MNNSKSVGVGIIGMGGMGCTEAEHCNAIKDAKLIAGVEPDESRRDSTKRKFGIRVYEDIDKFLERKDIDLVIICTPNIAHADFAITALKAGKKVLCQKPMATTLADCKKMVEVAKETKGYLQIGFEMRYSLLFCRIKEIIDQGEIGRVVNLMCNYMSGMWDAWMDHPGGWKWIKEKSGGMFPEKLCHSVDLFRYFMRDEVEEVITISAPNVIPYFEIIDNCHTSFRFKNGGAAHLTFMFTRAADFPSTVPESLAPEVGHQKDFSVIGTEGSLYCDIFDRSIVVIHYRENGVFLPKLTRKERYDAVDFHVLQHNTYGELKDIVKRIKERKGPFTAPEDSFRTMAVCFAAEESAELKRPVKVID